MTELITLPNGKIIRIKRGYKVISSKDLQADAQRLINARIAAAEQEAKEKLDVNNISVS